MRTVSPDRLETNKQLAPARAVAQGGRSYIAMSRIHSAPSHRVHPAEIAGLAVAVVGFQDRLRPVYFFGPDPPTLQAVYRPRVPAGLSQQPEQEHHAGTDDHRRYEHHAIIGHRSNLAGRKAAPFPGRQFIQGEIMLTWLI
jgi:hypothetical protein